MMTKGKVHPRQRAGTLFSASLRRFSALWLMVIFIVIFSVKAPAIFPTQTTVKAVLTGQVTVGMLAIAALIPVTAGVFDLSIGSMLAFGMVITTTLSQNHWNPLLASLVAIAVCAIVGAINGFIVVRFNVNSFIATLGMSEVLAAATLYISHNQQIAGAFPGWFQGVTQHQLFGINLQVYYLFIAAIIVWYVLEHTPVGRGMFATGGNTEAARLAGVSTHRIVWGTLTTSGAVAGLAGAMLASQLALYTGQEGPNYLFPAFAAVFFGATQIKSRPNVWGTLLAMYALAVGVEGLTLTSFSSQYWITPAFNGVALLIAVALASRNYTARAFRKFRRNQDIKSANGSTRMTATALLEDSGRDPA
jgi:ribose transport system permease protein